MKPIWILLPLILLTFVGRGETLVANARPVLTGSTGITVQATLPGRWLIQVDPSSPFWTGFAGTNSVSRTNLTTTLSGVYVEQAGVGWLSILGSTNGWNAKAETSITNGILSASMNYIDGATNGVFLSSTNAAVQNILARSYVTQTITNGILSASKTYTDGATNGVFLSSTNAAVIAVNASISNSTNTVASWIRGSAKTFCPSQPGATLHAQVQVASDSSFTSLLINQSTPTLQTGFYVFNGLQFISYPATGISADVLAGQAAIFYPDPTNMTQRAYWRWRFYTSSSNYNDWVGGTIQ